MQQQLVIYNDGGRKAAGYKGQAGDCATRAIAIATGMDYQTVYDELTIRKQKFKGKKVTSCSTARRAMPTKVVKRYLEEIGWKWVPTMKIGSGCKVHLRADELPKGRILARVSGHLVAVIDGVIHDTYDSSRNGTRCVYGYFIK